MDSLLVIYNFLLIAYLVVVVSLVGVILIQKSSSDGFTGAGGGNSLFSGRASANFLTRTTAILATLFLGMSMLIAYIEVHKAKEKSLIDQISEQPPLQVPGAAKTPEAPKVPLQPLENKAADGTTPPANNAQPENKPAEEKKPSVPVAE